MTNRSLSVVQRVSKLMPFGKTVKGVRTRSGKLREELKEAESVEQFIEDSLAAYDELIEEIGKVGNAAKERRQQMDSFLSDE